MGDLRVAHEASDARILVTDSLTYCDERVTGVLSAVNRTAAKAGAAVGMTVRDAAARMLMARSPSRTVRACVTSVARSCGGTACGS